MSLFYHIGRYFSLMVRVFTKPEKQKIYLRNIITEIWSLGVGSIGIVIVISVFMGAVITLQAVYNIENPLIPLYIVGLGTRDSMILEFSSTMVALILAGKVGSSIAGQIGTMRATEQIDALEIMGINSAAFLIMPKIVALVLFFPFLYIISVFLGILGGYLAVVIADVMTTGAFLQGVKFMFIPYYIVYSLIKCEIFAFIITSVASYEGYYVNGGSLEIGKAGTKAVVRSTILILIFNLILTQLLLT